MVLKKTGFRILYHAAALLIVIIMIYPLAWMLMSSFKANNEIFLTATSLIPKTWDVAYNYANGWNGIMGVGFWVFIGNSLFVSSLATFGSVFSSLLAAYAFARLKFKGIKILFVCVMATMMIPPQVMIVPQYIIFKSLGLLDNRFAMVMPWFFGSAFFIFLIMQFFRGIPIELDEAAEIDGCSKVQTLFSILLPNVTPALITSAIFSFYWSWQDFFTPLIFMNTTVKFPVSLGLKLFLDPESASEYGSMLAMSTVSLIPVLAVFIFFQKYLVEGTTRSGLKG
jgi:multiple sugar transport system permease protein